MALEVAVPVHACSVVTVGADTASQKATASANALMFQVRHSVTLHVSAGHVKVPGCMAMH